jgi:hypothetical protein
MKAYACGTPIRQKIVKAVATSLNCEFIPEAQPTYKGGDAVVWGLIRGAPELIEKVKKAGHTYWHMDNGYFARNTLFRITRNANQRTDLLERPSKRWEEIAKLFHITLSPWQKGSKIIVAQSTPHLYKFMGTDINTWTNSVVATLKKNTDREIVVRPKPGKKGSVPIESDLQNCHALVTHTSASALDALRMGVPVFTTSECCAKPLALQDLTKIEEPIYPEREPLFRHLSYCMFTREELERGEWKEWSGFS